MALKIKVGKPRGGARRFPVTYDVSFTGTPKAGEISQTRKKIQDSLKRHLAAQEKKGDPPRFKMTFKWKKMLSYELLVEVVRIRPASGGGGEVPPTPKSSILPM